MRVHPVSGDHTNTIAGDDVGPGVNSRSGRLSNKLDLFLPRPAPSHDSPQRAMAKVDKYVGLLRVARLSQSTRAGKMIRIGRPWIRHHLASRMTPTRLMRTTTKSADVRAESTVQSVADGDQTI
jgi:hypothetical protein